MKKLIFLGLILTLSQIAYAQRTVKKGGHIKDLNLQKFEGTWQAVSNKDTLLITFQNHKVYFKSVDFYMDLILGWYRYTHKGTVIEDDMNDVIKDDLKDVGSSAIKNSTINGKTHGNSKKMTIIFRDPNRDISLNGTFKLVGKRSKKAILKLHYGERIMVKYGNKKNEYKEKEGPKIPVPSTWHMKRIKK